MAEFLFCVNTNFWFWKASMKVSSLCTQPLDAWKEKYNHKILMWSQFHLERDRPITVHGRFQEFTSAQVPKEHETCDAL